MTELPDDVRAGDRIAAVPCPVRHGQTCAPCWFCRGGGYVYARDYARWVFAGRPQSKPED